MQFRVSAGEEEEEKEEGRGGGVTHMNSVTVRDSAKWIRR